jgi:disulfide bond formation protein DsbB
MPGFLRPFLSRWRLCALLYSAVLLAIAHGFETFGRLAPCTLCLRQREVYWVAIGASALFMVLVRLPDGPRWREMTNWALAAIFLSGAGIAAYHAGAEWKFWPGPTVCSGSGKVDAGALADLMNGARINAPHCDEAAWVFLGLSMAGWNALISLKLSILSVVSALYERSRR